MSKKVEGILDSYSAKLIRMIRAEKDVEVAIKKLKESAREAALAIQEYYLGRIPIKYDHLDKILQLYKGVTNYTRDYQIGFMEGFNQAIEEMKKMIGE